MVHDPAVVQESAALSERQRVEDGSDEAAGHVESRGAVFATPAMRVLRGEVVAGAPNRAVFIERLRPGKAYQGGEVTPESLSQFPAQRVVIGDAVAIDELDGLPLRIRCARTEWRWPFRRKDESYPGGTCISLRRRRASNCQHRPCLRRAMDHIPQYECMLGAGR